MGLILKTAPATEPITVAEARAHLRLDVSAGEVAPTAPTVALAGLGAGNVNSGAHRYRVTFITADGETEGGTISAIVTTAAGNGQVAVSAIPIGGDAVTSRKLYRTAAAGSDYLFLASVANNTTTTYADNIADGALGAACPTTNTTEDPVLTTLITVARKWAEERCERGFITQTWTYYLDAFPGGDIYIPLPRLVSVTHIKYYNTSGVLTTWLPATEYIVDITTEPGRVSTAVGYSWPSTQVRNNAVEIEYVCGYGAATAVPEGIKQAILEMIAWLYGNRGSSPFDAPAGIDMLLWPHSRVTL